MAKTPSTMLALGTPLPSFVLRDYDGKVFDTKEIKSCRALLVIFLCNHCPYVKHIAPAMARATIKMLAVDGVYVVGINSNDIEKYPEDRPELMKVEAETQGYRFPYLFDSTQAVAKAFQAACTPEFYLFDSSLRLAYRGQFDAARPGNPILPSGQDVLGAFEDLMQGKSPSLKQSPSLGCNIKWKPGQEPQY
jgi:peroxiredoxin